MLLIEASNAAQLGNARSHRIINPIWKYRHHAIPQILHDKAVLIANDRTNLPQVGIHKVKILLRGHLLRKRCKGANVRKHHGHFFADVVTQAHINDTVFVQESQVFTRHKSPVRMAGFRELQMRFDTG